RGPVRATKQSDDALRLESLTYGALPLGKQGDIMSVCTLPTAECRTKFGDFSIALLTRRPAAMLPLF
ncbi:MAG TPA: hypothetical protein VGH32_06730, partial [Pirellulales bacterium]